MSVSRPYLTNRPTLKKIKATNTNVTFARTLKTNTHAAERGIKYKTHALTHAHENEKKIVNTRCRKILETIIASVLREMIAICDCECYAGILKRISITAQPSSLFLRPNDL